jgi:hypothetical protein
MTTALDTEVARAEKLWEKVRSGFLQAQQGLIEVIATKAWAPHATFTEAWNAYMAGITLASELRPLVVYQMITEGLADTEIADAVKGLGPEIVELLRRQKANGVPADLATTRKPQVKSPTVTVFLRIPRAEAEDWDRRAERAGSTKEEIAYEATKSAMAELP